MDTAVKPQSFAQGQAPWEQNQQSQPQSFSAGSAPWEQSQNSDNQIQNTGQQSGQQPGQLGTLPKPDWMNLPVTSTNSTNPLVNFGAALKDEAVGAIKGGVSDLQGFGNLLLTPAKAVARALGDKADQTTGFSAESLRPKTQAEQFGGALSTAGQITAGIGAATDLAPKAVSKANALYDTYKGAKTVATAVNDTSKLAETVAPKATAKEIRLAQTQGRIVPGEKPTLFKGGTADTITPSKKTVSAAQTIQSKIPGASKMNPQELYSAVDKNITETAKSLRPQMEATPIKPETIQKINTDWESIKKNQIADAPATEETNVAKRQAKFESLLQKSGSSSHADLWDTRMNYDNSISSAVKKANSLSPESIQLQKNEWLQNRGILNDAINDTASGMGKTSQQAFSDMSNMYEAKNGLLSKAEINKAQPSKVGQFLKDHPKTAAAVGGVSGYEIAKKLGIPLP